MESVFINESPRDAMQGIQKFIPTQVKTLYINEILKVGFDVVDFGSFVSPKAIPQMRDTAEVLHSLDLSATKSRLSVVVGNKRGAEDAVKYSEIEMMGFPFSTSKTFLKLNLNTDIKKALSTIDEIQNICVKNNRILVIYFSMAFGNPYGDAWSLESVIHHISMLHEQGIKNITLSDTVGIANEQTIGSIFRNAIAGFPGISFGFHLHTKLDHWHEKIDAAHKAGCHSYDGVINGLGGCPMAGPGLVGNLDTGLIVKYFREQKIDMNIDQEVFNSLLNKLPLF